MRTRFVAPLVPLTILALSITALPTQLAAQSPTPIAKSAAPAAAARGWAAPRTPWGDPDLQGEWTSQGELGVPFERPVQFGTRQTMTEEEFATAAQRLQQERARDNAEFDLETADTSNAGQVGSATSPPPHWLERGTASRRTSMVIDPPDGRIPSLTPEGQMRIKNQVRGSFGNGPFNSPKDFTLYDRCITRGIPGSMFPAVYNANTRIVQGPGFVAIGYEMIHETRVIALEKQAHVSPAIRQYHGDSRARWEGDTLVVETRNFSDKVNYRGAGANLHLIERFTRVDPDTLRYEVTVEDPQTFTKPWTAALNLKPQTVEMFEYACHEGNYGMRNMLSAARAGDKTASEGQTGVASEGQTAAPGR